MPLAGLMAATSTMDSLDSLDPLDLLAEQMKTYGE